MLSKVYACAEITFLGQLAYFILIIFIYLFSFIRGRKHYKNISSWEGENSLSPFSSQIYSSYLRDYIGNLDRNIKAFSNAIKNIVVSLL